MYGTRRNNGEKQAQDHDNMCLFSVLLYACETCTLKEADVKKLLAFEMKCYRRILHIWWEDEVRSIDVRKRIAAHTTIVDVIKRRKLGLF